MTHEQSNPQAPDFDPYLQSNGYLRQQIALLRDNAPEISVDDLFSSHFSSRLPGSEYPDKPSVSVELDTPICRAYNQSIDVVQDLMAVVVLGEELAMDLGTAALGAVKGRDQSGSEVTYLSLLSSNPHGNDKGRARFISVLAEGAPITIGRGKVEQVIGREGSVPAVSRTHCTIELREGILTVVDENSTNGTTVYTNTTPKRTNLFGNIGSWCQPSGETKKYIEAARETKKLSRIIEMGKIPVDNS